MTAVLGVVLVSGSLVGLGSQAAVADATDGMFDEVTAAALARSSGRRVEVLRLRSQTDQVFRNPDGTTTREQYQEPVRVKRGAQWLSVDSTLATAADGSLAPVVAAVDMSFSGGGDAPLVSVERDGVRVSLSWPTSLPRPTLDGPSATYAEVYPGVDLVMTSVGTSYTQHLVVRTAVAARQQAVRSLQLATSVTGGELIARAAGGFEVLDRRGRAVWSSPAPMMWDSAADAPAVGNLMKASTPLGDSGSGEAQDAQDGPRDGDKVAAIGQVITAGAMRLTPDATMLDSASTRFPVTIDPTTGPATYRWAMVNKTYPTTSYVNFVDQDMGVGYNDFSGTHIKRTFFQFDTHAYNDRTVQSATLSAFETFSAYCSAGTVDAYLTANLPSSMTWSTQAARASGILSSFSVKAGRSDCHPGGYRAEFNVTNGVRTRASAGQTYTTIGLAGRSESSNSSWMRFAGPKNSTVANRPKLSVTYNSTPDVPSTTKMFAPDTNTSCATTAASSKRFNQTSSSAYFIATARDRDAGNLTMTFSLFNAVTGASAAADRVVGPIATATYAVGGVFKYKIPATWNDGSYYWISKVTDGTATSGWSGRCYITFDKTAPPKPSITSSTFIKDVLAPQDLASGGFTASAAGAVSFDYYWNGVKKAALAVNGSSGGAATWTGSLALPATDLNWLQVVAVDGAGNHSPLSEAFYVKRAVGGKLAQYLFNDRMSSVPDPAVVKDSARNGSAEDPIQTADRAHYTFDLATDAGWDEPRFPAAPTVDNSSLLLGGTGEQAVSEERPAASERSFTIGTWAYLTDDSSSRTLVAQNLEVAPTNPEQAPSAYGIGYDQVSDRFVFHVTTATGAIVTASDALPTSVTDPSTGEVIDLPRTGAWVYLAAIYDRTAKTIRLDVAHEYNRNPLSDPFTSVVSVTNGTPQSLTADVKPGLGAFRVGDGAIGTSPWAGRVDNLSVWQQALTDSGTNNGVYTNANKQL